MDKKSEIFKLARKYTAAFLSVCISFAFLPTGIAKAIEETSTATIINIATELGDCNSSGEVDVIDLVRMKKWLVNTEYECNEILSDLKCDGKIDAGDLVLLRKKLLGENIASEAYPRTERTKYNVNSAVVADANVLDFGAIGDGITDNTSAFVDAMASLGEQGGTVWVPAGRYKLTQNITIPANVILQGDFADPEIYGTEEVKNGSCLEIYPKTVEEGNEEAFFKIEKYGSIKGFMIWYPEQKIENGQPIEYPYTIELSGWQSVIVKDLYIVNAYKGIDDTRNPHNSETVQNVYMTALYYGMEWEYNNDIARYENINMGPSWWLDSGLENIPNAEVLGNWMQENGTGIKVESIDDAYISDLSISGYKTGIYFGQSGYGKIYNLNIDNCNVGLYLGGTGAIYGFTVTNGYINANSGINPVAIYSAADNVTPLGLYNVELAGNGKYIIENNGQAGYNLTNCSFELNGSEGEYAIYNNSGYVAASGCSFIKENETAKCVYISENITASSFVNCNTSNDFDYDCEDNEKIFVAHNEEDVCEVESEITSYELQQRKPQREALYNVLNYGAKTINFEETVIIDDENDESFAYTSVTTEQVKVGAKALKSTTADHEGWITFAGFWGADALPAKDLSEVTNNGTSGALKFWLYVEDISMLDDVKEMQANGTYNIIKLGDAKSPDGNYYRWNHWIDQVTASGWNEVILKFADASIEGNEPDITAIDTLYMKLSNGASSRTLYIDDVKAVSYTSEDDVSDALQSAIDDAYKNGGGIVYIPSGDWLIQNPVNVKSGVEIRGSCDNPHFGTAMTTALVTDYGRNDENGTALITMESDSGIRGITVDYSETCMDGTPYAYTLRGNGKNVYVINCTVDSAYQVLDLKSAKCDNHYVEALTFGTTNMGIAVGGGSENGVVRDCQSNPTSNRDQRHTVYDRWITEDGSSVANYTLENVTGYTVGNTVNQTQFMNFIYGCKIGLEINQAADIISIGHGTDQAYYGIRVSDSANALIFSTELPVKQAFKSYAVYTSRGYQGTTDVINAEIWAVGQNAFYCGGGSLNAYNCILSQCGKTAMVVANGKVRLATCILNRLSDSNFKLLKDAEGLSVYGNLYIDSKNALVSTSSKVSGADIQNLELCYISEKTEKTADFWNGEMTYRTDYTFLNVDSKDKYDGNEKYIGNEFSAATSEAVSIKLNSSVDVLDAEYLELDLYISDISLIEKCNGGMQLELSSSNFNDKQELGWDYGYFKNAKLESGWNHLKLDLSKSPNNTGDFNSSAVTRLRYYINFSSETEGEIGVRNITFTKSDLGGNVKYWNDHTDSSGWNTAGCTLFSYTAKNNAYYRLTSPISYSSPATDISEAEYFEFDLWISDAELFNSITTNSGIELTSSGTYDAAEINYSLYSFTDILTDGWNRIRIPISFFENSSSTEESFNSTALNYFRIYTNISDLGIAVSNLKFIN